MPRFMLEGLRPCTIFCFALIHYAWITWPTRFYWLVPQFGVNNYCVLSRFKAKKSQQKHTTKSFVEFHNHSPLLTMVKYTMLNIRCQDLCWKVHDPAQSPLFCAHTLCMNYVTNTFLLVSPSVRSKQLLCFVQGQGQKKPTKTYNKELCRVS